MLTASYCDHDHCASPRIGYVIGCVARKAIFPTSLRSTSRALIDTPLSAEGLKFTVMIIQRKQSLNEPVQAPLAAHIKLRQRRSPGASRAVSPSTSSTSDMGES